MKEFRTELIPRTSLSPIGLKEKIFTIGSCFSDEIGQVLIENKFTVKKNIFGAVYNPISIHQLLLFGLNNTFPSVESYSQKDDVHFNYHFHSAYSSLKRADLESKIRNSMAEAYSFLQKVDRVVITYGTAFTYQLKSTGMTVANCHKVPSSNFEKRLLNQTDIVKSFQEFYSRLKLVNPSAKIILTVSPVRHLKDTLELNAVSKSILRLACHSLASEFSDVEYFPAYEILLDDLRDYRFYKTDRLHPTDEAVEYIWQKFVDTYFSETTKRFVAEWKKVSSDLAHRPFLLESESHQKFLKSLLLKLENLQSEVDLSQEVQLVKSKIKN